MKVKTSKLCESANRGRPKGSTAREDILENAGKAFVKHGYQNCTVENILCETGASRTNFYRFFKNKEEVFEQIFVQSLENLAKQMQTARSTLNTSLSTREKIEYLLEKYLRACFCEKELLPIIIQESDSLPRYRKIKETVLNRFLQRITAIIESDGNGPVDPLLVEGFMAAVDRIMLLEAQKKNSVEEKITRCKLSLMKFIDVLIKSKV